jgi:hypothetical protein
LAEFVHTEVRSYTGGQQNPTSDKPITIPACCWPMFHRTPLPAGSVAELAPALNRFEQMPAINPDLEQADIARKNVTAIQEYFRRP